MQATNEPPSEYIIFEYSAEDAARTSICTVTHIQVVSAQLEFLKQQIRDFQVKYARPVHEPARLSIDQKPAEFKIQGRVATDFEAALASLFDHENKISLLAAMHTFVVLMNKCRSVCCSQVHAKYLSLSRIFTCIRLMNEPSVLWLSKITALKNAWRSSFSLVG